MKIVNLKNNSHFLRIGILPIVLVWFIVLFFYVNRSFIEIVNQGKSIPYSVYTDKELNGNSSASAENIKGKGINFTCKLQDGYLYPYTGICFVADSGMLNFDSGSNFILELSMETAGIIPIILNEYTKSIYGKTYTRSVQYELKTLPGSHAYTFPLKDFDVPSWWYKKYHVLEQDFPPINFTKIKNICLQNSSLTFLNKNESMIIKQLRNDQNIRPLIWLAVLVTFSWFVGYVIFSSIKKRQIPIFIPYVTTELEEIYIDEWEKIRNFISSNYMNDIDMEMMEKALGIAKHKIAGLIKDNSTLIFKQYLNHIKVAEAKRLLMETKLPIGEIADQVGFGHLSNFNRVFKQYTGESPSELRKQLNN